MDPGGIERAAAAAWPATEVEERDGWLLRHTPGLDRARSNAALPLAASPDVAVVEAWYADRGAPARVQAGPLPEQDALDARLAGAGWAPSMRVDVLTGAAADVPAPGRPVAVLSRPTARWLEAWTAAEGRHDASAHQELVFARLPTDRAAFAMAPGGAAVGLGIATADGACGLFCMATRADERRRGLGAAVLGGLAQWACGVGAGTLYLQVLEENAPARALYEAAGLERSHGYVHRAAPA